MAFFPCLAAADLLVPAVMIVFGCLFIYCTPKSINGVYGYRTKMSMKNQETWDFAHKYCGKIWKWTGLILLVLTGGVLFLIYPADEDMQEGLCVAFLAVQTVILIVSLLPVEKALKRQFDKDGKRKL